MDARAATLWAGIVFCVLMLAMTVSVVLEIEIEEWTLGTFLLIGFVIGGVADHRDDHAGADQRAPRAAGRIGFAA